MLAHKRTLYALYVLFFVASAASTYFLLTDFGGLTALWSLFIVIVLILATQKVGALVDRQLGSAWAGYNHLTATGYIVGLLGVQRLFETIYRFERALAQQDLSELETSSYASFSALMGVALLVASVYFFGKARKIAAKAKGDSSPS